MLKFHIGDTVKVTKKDWKHRKIGVVKYTIPRHFRPFYMRGKRRMVPRKYYVEFGSEFDNKVLVGFNPQALAHVKNPDYLE